MKKRFWNETDEQETLKRQLMKIETDKINKVYKVQEHQIRIELIKETTKVEDLEIERVDKLNEIEEIIR